jgi:GSH-dependent disulfide-bond oxidoreductase
MPRDPRGKYEVLQWLYWQIGGLGPTAGQNHHFKMYTPVKLHMRSIATSRKPTASNGVIERRLQDRPFLAGDY